MSTSLSLALAKLDALKTFGRSNSLQISSLPTGTAPQQQSLMNSESIDGAKSHLSTVFSKRTASERSSNSSGVEGRPGKPLAPAASSFLVLSQTKKRSLDSKPCFSVNDKRFRNSGDDRFDRGAKLGLNEKKGCSFCTCAGPKNLKIWDKNLARTSPDMQKNPPNGPALGVVWKGSFEVIDGTLNVGLCKGFLAHPPEKVSDKAYELSKKLGDVVQFRLHPRCDVWPGIFRMECPDGNDIALYFYPGNFERSRKKYSFLLKYIERHDLALRSCLGNVELLVFASKHLHVDSQKLKGSFFMWGVFRRLKANSFR